MSAATATANGDSVSGKLLLAAAGLIWFAGYLLACRFWPFKACRKCNGTGKIRSPSGRAWRKCRRCKGTQARLRWGRHVLDYVKSTKGATKK